jgi:hypothetical protein
MNMSSPSGPRSIGSRAAQTELDRAVSSSSAVGLVLTGATGGSRIGHPSSCLISEPPRPARSGRGGTVGRRAPTSPPRTHARARAAAWPRLGDAPQNSANSHIRAISRSSTRGGWQIASCVASRSECSSICACRLDTIHGHRRARPGWRSACQAPSRCAPHRRNIPRADSRLTHSSLSGRRCVPSSIPAP